MKMFINKILELVWERNSKIKILCLLAILILADRPSAYSQTQTVRFAAVGDYGAGDNNERDVANLIKSWNPDFIITLGDNNYPDGETATIDKNIGQFYHDFIYPYQGSYGAGASVNRFFPCLGNRDWDNQIGAPAQPFLDYFVLPGNERYYDFVQGPVHFFCIDSDSQEPDGITGNSIQANWLRNRLAASTSPWKIVYLHHPPYSSRTSYTNLRWAYQQWGATAVLSGHAHVYERVMVNGMPYFTNGLGGDSTGSFGGAIAGSVVRFGTNYGAQLITATNDSITFQFITRAGVTIDTFTIGAAPPTPTLSAPTNLTATGVFPTQVNLAWTDNSNNEGGFKIERCQNLNCNNFVEIGSVGSNITAFNNGGLSANTTYAYRVRAFSGSTFSGYSNTIQVSTPPVVGGGGLFSDDFNDNITDNSKWLFGIFTRSASNFDPQVQVFEQNGVLTIVPHANYSPASYNGYVSNMMWDLSQNSATVEVVQKASGNAATLFSVGINNNNWYGFRAKGNTLFLESRINGVTTGVTPTYNAVLHRFWRFRYHQPTDAVLYETSPDSVNWTTLWSAPRLISLSAVRIEMAAGTSGLVATPEAALFDNFYLAPSGTP